MEQSRYDQQGLFNEQKFEADEAFRRDQLAAQETEAKSQAEKRDAETKQIEAQNTAAAQERSAKLATISASNATRGALMSGGSLTPVFDEGRKVFANDPVALQAYTNAIYDTFTKSTGLTEGEVNNAVSSVLRPLKQFINTPYDDPAKMLAGFERVLDSVDPDLTDNIRPEAVARPDGTWAIKYGDAELPGLEGKDLQEVASKYMRTVSTDPLEAISIYDRNKNLQISKIASAKTQAEQAKLFIEFAKNNPQVMKDETAAGRLLDIIQGDVGGLSYDPKDWGTSGATSNVEALALAAKQLGVSVPEQRAGVSQTLDKQVQAKTKETEDRSKFEQDVSNMINSTAALLREQYGNDKGAMARAVREALTTPGISLVEEAALRELYRQSYLP
jgi:hypothetical protein